MKQAPKIKKSIAVALFVFFICHSNAFSAPSWHRDWLLGQLPDPVESPSKDEINILLKQAMQGEWVARQQIATAYLYETWKTEFWNRGCEVLKNGHYCRALATEIELGKKYLEELVDLPATGPVPAERLARFQVDYARRVMLESRPEYDVNSASCKIAMKYFAKAMSIERAETHQSCTARRLSYMYRYGTCTPIDSQKSADIGKISNGCAVD